MTPDPTPDTLTAAERADQATLRAAIEHAAQVLPSALADYLVRDLDCAVRWIDDYAGLASLPVMMAMPLRRARAVLAMPKPAPVVDRNSSEPLASCDTSGSPASTSTGSTGCEVSVTAVAGREALEKVIADTIPVDPDDGTTPVRWEQESGADGMYSVPIWGSPETLAETIVDAIAPLLSAGYATRARMADRPLTAKQVERLTALFRFGTEGREATVADVDRMRTSLAVIGIPVAEPHSVGGGGHGG